MPNPFAGKDCQSPSKVSMVNEGFMVDLTPVALSCSGLTIDMVEDRLTTAIECASIGIKVFLYPAPWNKQDFPEDLPIYRVSSWDEIMEKLMKTYKEKAGAEIR